MSSKIAVIGECMLELSHQLGSGMNNTLQTGLSYGGDTLNTAIYLARLGNEVDYLTALGDDYMSQWMVTQWRAEGVGCELIRHRAGRVPGMYMIKTDMQGERSFLYWRNESPARELFDDPVEADWLFEKLASYACIYLSGITLAIYSEEAQQRLFDFLIRYRAAGGKVIFDGNCRPKLWPSVQVAKATYERMYQMTDIALPTLSDESLLFGEETSAQCMTRLRSYHINEVALKMGGLGAVVSTEQGDKLVETVDVAVLDTTAAGDSFNAGYLTARLLRGSDTTTAALAGHALASTVIQYRGAVIPADLMPPIAV